MGLVNVLQRTAVRKGVLGTSRGWLAVAIGTWGVRRLRRLATRDEEVVLREELQPGESLVITHTRETRG